MAVKGRSKAEILAAFEMRLAATRTAMQHDQWDRVAAAYDFVPDLPAGDIDIALFYRASEGKLRVARGQGFRGS